LSRDKLHFNVAVAANQSDRAIAALASKRELFIFQGSLYFPYSTKRLLNMS
jgi:hypothetical protein